MMIIADNCGFAWNFKLPEELVPAQSFSGIKLAHKTLLVNRTLHETFVAQSKPVKPSSHILQSSDNPKINRLENLRYRINQDAKR